MSNDSFSSATSIEVLYLNDNNLQYDKLPANIFQKLNSLRVLLIHNNNWTHLKSYPDNLFSSLSSMEFLALDGFPGVKFGEVFADMNKLDVLHIYGGVDVLQNDTLAAFRNSPVTELSLKTKMSLSQIESGTFAHFSQLRTLDLGYNQNLGLQNVSNAWWGLRNTIITKLVLTAIVSSNDQIANQLTSSFFEYLNLIQLETLLIDKNNIVVISPGWSAALIHIVHLDLSYNRISMDHVIGEVVFLRKLKYFDLSHQTRRFISGDVMTQGKVSSYQSEHIPFVPENSSNDWFANHCRITPFQPCQPNPPDRTGTWCVLLPPYLEVINLTEAVIMDIDSLQPLVLLTAGRLRRLEYRNNGIRKLFRPLVVTGACNVTIDFSDNGLACAAPDFLKISYDLGTRVKGIYLSGNSLAEQLENDVNGQTFQYFGEATVLDLSRNGLKTLPVDVFRHAASLELLNLGENSLQIFDLQLSHMSRLVELNVSYNLITTFDYNATDRLTTLFRNSHLNANLSIDLTGNPLQCSCETLAFLRWISLYRRHMINFANYNCYFNGSMVLFLHLDDHIIVELADVCSRRLAVIVSAIACALVLILIALSIFVYLFRWEVRYWCLWLTHRSRLYRELMDDDEYDFDAFVAYAYQDGDWVRNELVPSLELTGGSGDLEASELAVGDRSNVLGDDNGLYSVNDSLAVGASSSEVDDVVNRRLKVCIHERDFTVGRLIFDNIWSTMERSRNVILVISPNFLKSKFCDYELNLARMESVQKGRNMLIPIILEPVRMEDMSAGLRWIVRKLTYIEWPTEVHREVDRAEFWQALRNAVVDRGLSMHFHRN